MIGETINNHRITQLLGEGGMGAVYLAEHPFMGRKAAIKVLRREFAEDPGLVERFMNEARAANAIRHPNIIDIIDVGRMPSGIPYLMMEFLEGESLADRIRRGKLGIPEAMDVILQTTGALAAAHGKGIVHRDLKPDNLFLIPDDSAPGGIRVKVLDFGIAKLRADLSGGMAKTQAGSLMGTPPYMSPEQCRGITEEIDHRTDVYAMGVILYELLCGAPPFVSAGWGEVVLAHLTKAPAPPRSKNADIPEALEAVILRALAKSADERFGSASEMRAALRPLSSMTTFPPRQTAAALAAAHAAPGNTTTFRTATGEMKSVPHALPAARPKRRFLLLSGGVAAAGAIATAIAMNGGNSREPASPSVAPAIATSAAAAPQPVAQRPPPRATPTLTPPVPAHIQVRIASEPAGALVTDAKRGVVIGATPFEQRMDRTMGKLDLRLAKAGFARIDIEIPLDQDYDKTIKLDRQRAPKRRHSSSVPSSPVKTATGGGGPPAGATPTAQPAAAPAAPPAPAPAPPAKPKSAEKW
jgi:eukaryotic-like serine/threonine-protein kinase